MQTILAVDDEEENLFMVEHTLSEDYRVVAVNSGTMALKYLHQEIPDLILLDIKMPQMDGFEVLNTIRGNKDWKLIPVVFLSSYKKVYSDAELMQSGVADYIGKPFDANIMKRRISDVMNQMRDEVKRGQLQFKPLEIREETASEEVIEKVIEKQPSVPVTIDDMVSEVQADKIISVEMIQNNCIVCTRHMEVRTPLNLEQIQTLVGDNFIKAGRNILVNTSYVRNIVGEQITLENDRTITVQEQYREAFSKRVLKQFGNKIK